MTPTEIYDDMQTRCWEVDTIHREEQGAPGAAVGHMIRSATGHMLTIEAGVDDDGRAFVAVRVFDPNGDPVTPTVMDAGDSVMAVTP